MSSPALRASDSNYLRSKTSRPAGGGRMCERRISGPRSPAAATSCPGRPGGPCPSWFLTVGYLCRAHGSFHSKGHCVEKGWARNDWFLLGSISRSGSSGPTDRFLLFCFALSLFLLVTHEDTESKIRPEKRLHCAVSILFPQYVCIT